MFTSFKSIVATYVHTIIIIILYLQLLPIYNVIYVVYCLVPDPTGLGTYWYGLYTRRGSSKPQPTLALCCQVTDASLPTTLSEKYVQGLPIRWHILAEQAASCKHDSVCVLYNIHISFCFVFLCLSHRSS